MKNEKVYRNKFMEYRTNYFIEFPCLFTSSSASLTRAGLYLLRIVDFNFQ
jgi:hypothetical protein